MWSCHFLLANLLLVEHYNTFLFCGCLLFQTSSQSLWKTCKAENLSGSLPAVTCSSINVRHWATAFVLQIKSTQHCKFFRPSSCASVHQSWELTLGLVGCTFSVRSRRCRGVPENWYNVPGATARAVLRTLDLPQAKTTAGLEGLVEKVRDHRLVFFRRVDEV